MLQRCHTGRLLFCACTGLSDPGRTFVSSGADVTPRRLKPARTIRRAFTMTEILVGVALAAILGAIVIPTVFGRIADANIQRKASTLSTIAQALMTFHDQVGMWPDSLTKLIKAPAPGKLNICG